MACESPSKGASRGAPLDGLAGYGSISTGPPLRRLFGAGAPGCTARPSGYSGLFLEHVDCIGGGRRQPHNIALDRRDETGGCLKEPGPPPRPRSRAGPPGSLLVFAVAIG